MARNRYIITEGDPDREEPSFLCAVSEETLEATLRQLAEQTVKDKGDVTTLRVWALTGVEVTTKAFDILGLDKLAEKRR